MLPHPQFDVSSDSQFKASPPVSPPLQKKNFFSHFLGHSQLELIKKSGADLCRELRSTTMHSFGQMFLLKTEGAREILKVREKREGL